MGMDWPQTEETTKQHHQTRLQMEPTRKEKQRTTQKHLAQRHRVRIERAGTQLVLSRKNSAKSSQMEGVRQWPMLPSGAKGLSKQVSNAERFHCPTYFENTKPQNQMQDALLQTRMNDLRLGNAHLLVDQSNVAVDLGQHPHSIV